MSFTPRVEGIGTVLASARVSVPDYQRSYSWGDTQVGDFWTDLKKALDENTSEYFLGSVVLTRTRDERLAVVDGQQRLATASLLIAAIVDIFEERSDERAGEIRSELLGKKDVVTRVVTQNLKLNVEDNELFRQITLSRKSERNLAPTRESNKALAATHAHFLAQLQQEIAGLGQDQWQPRLTAWYALLKSKATILQLVVDDESRAFTIFETLNARGVGLNTADLLRNHVLGLAGNRLDEAKSGWTSAFSIVSSGGESEPTDKFLRHFWASREGVVRVKGLFNQIKPTVKDQLGAIEFMGQMRETAPLWAAMYDRDAPLWSGFPTTALDAHHILKRLGVEQCRPLLLAVLRRFPPADALKIFRLVMNWSIRWVIAGGGGGGTVERLYAEAARDVTASILATVPDIARRFANNVPNDAAFALAFATQPIQQGWLARYLLRVLEKERTGDQEPEFVPNEDVESVNLEHVLPKSASGEWLNRFPDGTAASFRFLMGNQALLRKSHNGAIGDKPFIDKKPILAASDFLLTKQIAESPDWTRETVRKRGDELALLAIKAWHID